MQPQDLSSQNAPIDEINPEVLTVEEPPKHPGGRPTDYKPEYCEQIIEFFGGEPYHEETITITTKTGATIEKTERKANDMPFFEKFAANIGVTHKTLLNWTDNHPEFLQAYMRAKEMQKNFLAVNSLLGNYDSRFAIFTAKNITDWRDVKEIKHDGKIEGGTPNEEVKGILEGYAAAASES